MPSLKLYDQSERIRRVLRGSYFQLTNAAEKGLLDLAKAIDILDAVKDLSAKLPDDAYLSEWTVDKAGDIVWDPDEDAEEISLLERRKRLAINRDLHSFLRKLRTADANHLRAALRDCAFGEGTHWPWEVTTSGSIIMPDVALDLRRQRATYGARGGRARTPKGLAKASAGQRSATAKKGVYKRWGREVIVTTKVIYLPKHEDAIVAEAPESREVETDSIHGAILSYVSHAMNYSALEKMGLLAIETSAGPSQAFELDEQFERVLNKYSLPNRD